MLSRRPKVLVIDVGGTHVKVLASGRREPREIPSGPSMDASGMVAAVKRLTADWRYDVVSIGYPGVVVHDAAMQALGSYRRGRMLFLGLGTGLGSAMIIDGVLEPMELAHLPYRKGRTYEDYVGRGGLERLGKKRWRRHVADVAERLQAALEADDVVVGGGNAKLLKTLPAGVRRGDNANAFLGGLRLWDDRRAHADGVRAHDAHGRRSRGLGRARG